MRNKILWIVIVVGVLLGGGIFWLNSDITQKKYEVSGVKTNPMTQLSDDDPRFDTWGKFFPDYLDMYLSIEKQEPKPTDFGGNLAYSKLIRYPQLTILWAGYAFSADFNEERGHFYAQSDQMSTARNNKDFLNSFGLKAFNGQPTACMNCHSGWMPWLYKNVAKNDWIAFNTTPYWTMIKNVPVMDGKAPDSEAHRGLHGGTRMGLTCADCHNPDDMSLRLTRPAAINALIARGYQSDPIAGVKASRQEMRTLVCSQCHVEYYFRPTGEKVTIMGESISKDPQAKWWNGSQKNYDDIDIWRNGNEPIEVSASGLELAFPWSEWKKDKPFRIEMFDEYYEKVRDIFPYDWIHKDTKAPLLKMQHPESEMYSGGIHAANGVSCADCHMPYVRKGSKKMSQHNLISPLDDINSSCKSCHTQTEDYLRNQVHSIQNSVAFDLRSAEYAIVSLITDIKYMREQLGKLPAYQTDGKPDDAKISKALQQVLELHRKSQMRADFVNAENSGGFHNPKEAGRALLQATDMARYAQALLAQIAAANQIDFKVSNLTFEDIQKFNPGELKWKADVNGHKKGDRYYHEEDVNIAPPKDLIQLDKDINPYNYKVLDKNVTTH
ncbi:ammonia-forming cytochrome c nitrite reductase subunit c552 [Helicobacter sp. 11S02596-1]|uniref:ammonia-forming cytochrome c nitrite reductase subunit c552 n=1 Tax=Helicobacter sp. 11S02596-1 TaxID=1476194 RepID=UPI000BA539FE|nr:ammonia-forming cytochrome c nitrite reductase subunit c552 [Helicobacter sp. 11S02596-1]PAF42112.1 cytochrome C [Helicobacter sp. 11S02596-1]